MTDRPKLTLKTTVDRKLTADSVFQDIISGEYDNWNEPRLSFYIMKPKEESQLSQESVNRQ